jgi:nucleotide-binding universal stress UspA family protein
VATAIGSVGRHDGPDHSVFRKPRKRRRRLERRRRDLDTSAVSGPGDTSVQPQVSYLSFQGSNKPPRAIDMLVMGAYGHARLQEMVLGGVTREMLRTMTVPTLMSH